MGSSYLSLLAAAAALVTLPAALARAGEPEAPPQTAERAGGEHGPGAKVSFNLEDADITELVRVVGELTGRRFVVASGRARGLKATVYSPEKVTVDGAYRAFLAILQANGLTVLPEGPFDAIVDAQDASRLPTPVQDHAARGAGLELVTRIHHLHHVGASEVTTNVLSRFGSQGGSIVPYEAGNLVILTDTGENVARLERILTEIDVPGPHLAVFFQPLFYVPARDLQKTLDGVFDVGAEAGPGKPAAATIAPAASAPAANSPAPASGRHEHAGRIVAVDHPNALVIVSSQAAYLRMLELIRRIDVPSTDGGEMHVVPLAYADAKKIAPAINEAITGVTSAASGTNPQGGAAKVNAAPAGQPSGALFGAALSAPARVSAEDTTNSLLVSSSMRDFAAIREVIRELDRPKRQVYIEAVVMDLSIQRSQQLGVSYHLGAPTSDGSLAYGGLNPLTSIAAPSDPSVLQGFALGVRGPSSGQSITLPNGTGLSIPAFGVLLNAMLTSDDADILQTPHIMATDNTPAEIKVQLHTALSSTPTFQSAAGTALGAGTAAAGAAAINPFAGTYSTPYGQIGPDIKITPHIADSDEIRLDIDESISDLVATPPAGALSSSTAVSYTERDATTTLTVKDQETIVIGGLVHDKVERTQQKIPVLGDLPVFGALFRSTSDSVTKNNLVLVLTPYVIHEAADLRRVFERKMQERQEFMDHEAVFGGHRYDPPRDWTRRQGLLGEIRAAYADVLQKRAAEDALAPKPEAEHPPVAPIEAAPSPASPR